jgi:excinuclease ABC subunit B
MPQTDTYIEKDTQINEKIERLRLEATAMLLSGEPTIIVSTVSCIYSLGNPQDWNDLAITVNVGDVLKRSDLIKKFIDARYERNDIEMTPGKFRVKGDTIDIIPAYSEDIVRISMFGDDIEKITLLDNVSLKEKRKISQMQIFPAKHYLIAKDVREKAVISIKSELEKRLPELNELEKQRLEMRTKYDL